jgi:hypothetical protein
MHLSYKNRRYPKASKATIAFLILVALTAACAEPLADLIMALLHLQ